MSGQTPQLLSAHPIPAGSSKPWAQALEAPAPTLSKGLCAIEHCLGSGSEQAKSPIRHCIT